MLVFLDTEFTDFIDCELISIGLISEDGLHTLYLEVQDFDRNKCNAFVQSEVWAHLGKLRNAIVRKDEVGNQLRSWFSTLSSSVTVAFDSEHDRRLLAIAFDGPWPANLTNWYDLGALAEKSEFSNSIENYYSVDRPCHHALFDAQANRVGWLAWLACQKKDI